MEGSEKSTGEKTVKNEIFQHFSEKINQKDSIHLKNNFIKDVQEDMIDDPDLPKVVANFRDNFEEECQLQWRENMDNEVLNGEAIEAILTRSLYDQLLSNYPIDKDKKLDKLLYIFQFIEPAHLELNEDHLAMNTMEYAFNEIHKIDKYKTPRDKVISIINCCKIVSGMISHAQKNQDRPTGADDFLPALIYTIIRARPKHVYSNIAFIRDYRSPSRLRGMEDYYYTAYHSAVEFIEALDVTKLKIKKDDYDRLYSQQKIEYEKMLSKDLGKEDSKIKENGVRSSVNPPPETEDSIINDKQIAKRINDLRPYAKYESKEAKFYNSEFMKLTVNDLEELFHEYKKLCNSHQKAAQKIETLVIQIEEKKNNSKKPDTSYWTLWKGK